MKYLVIMFALFGAGRLGQLGYFTYNDYHSTICKEAGWEFIDKTLGPNLPERMKGDLQASIATQCFLKYGRTY